MAADVSYLSRILNGGDKKDSGEPTATRDLLGGNCSLLDSKELDLDLHVPSGFEKKLDLKSGKVYIQRCDSANSSSTKSEENKENDTISKLQDLNFPPSSKESLKSNISDESNIDLKLVLFPLPSSSATPPAASSTSFYSVCTLDKVKSALERAEKESNYMKRRSVSMSSSPPPSNSSPSVKDGELMKEEEKSSSSSSSVTYAAACPNCLLYVLVSKNNPKCPRCYATVPSPTAFKKPRIDLNISL